MTKQTSAQGTSLDSDLETFRDDLRKTSDLVVRLYGGLDRARVTPAKVGWRSPRCLTSRSPRSPSRWKPSCGRWRTTFLRIPRYI